MTDTRTTEEAIDNLHVLLRRINDELPDDSGHPILRRFFVKANDNDNSIVASGNIPIAQVPSDLRASADLFSIMNPVVVEHLMNLLFHLNEDESLSEKSQRYLEAFASEINYSARIAK